MNNLSVEAGERVVRTLGEGVIKLWSSLPQPIQQDLFEAAVAAEGEDMRAQLAVLLHGAHTRTADGLKARALMEPDSKGG